MCSNKCSTKNNMPDPGSFDIQGHRGARGLFPENTITAFLEAVKLGVPTLECDVVISKDQQVVISHEPWMNHQICLQPNGEKITEDREKSFNLFEMNYKQIQKFDCGSKQHPEFPVQKNSFATKPLLREMILAVDEFTELHQLNPVKFNIEIKSEATGDSVFHPLPETFAQLVYDELKKLNVLPRVILQSFDERILNKLFQIDSTITYALLAENNEHFEENLKKLIFKPAIYAPDFTMTTPDLIQAVHQQNIRIIPWTVNEKEDMQRLTDWGVDGIITDYPDRLMSLLSSDNFSAKKRKTIIQKSAGKKFDLIIIGGGITGAGIALDATVRGLTVALVEMQDFAGGTSGRSTKLIHGGLRYLKQFELKLVAEVGQEREILHRNAQHLVIPEPMILPITKGGNYKKFSAKIGMWIYEWLAGVKRKERHRYLKKEKLIQQESLLNKKNIRGGFLFYEYRTDDSRLTIEVLKEAVKRGATALNYIKASSFIYDEEKICGIKVIDQINGEETELFASYIVNAGGPWADLIDDLEKNPERHKLQLTKGIHLVVDHKKLPLKQAVYFDATDKRMIFAIPRNGKTYIGTTDTFYHENPENPQITKEDRDYLLSSVNNFFSGITLSSSDIESGWAGVRPLVNKPGKGPSEISRKDEIFESASGLITIAGGKLTGYRKMAKRVVDLIAKKISFSTGKNIPSCSTHSVQLSGGKLPVNCTPEKLKNNLTEQAMALGFSEKELGHLLNLYGSETGKILKIAKAVNNNEELPLIISAQIQYCIENECCFTAYDFIIRRTAGLYFNLDMIKKYHHKIVLYFQKQIQYNDSICERDALKINAEIQALDQLRAE